MTNEEFASKFEATPDKFTNDGAISLIVRLYAVLTGAIERVRKARSTASVGVKKAIEIVSADDATVNRASEIADMVRETVFSAIRENENLSLLLPDHFGFIVDEIRDVRSLVMDGMNIEDDDDDEDTVDVSEDIEVSKFASTAIRNYATLLGMHGLSVSDLPASMVRLNKKGEAALSLPKVPSDEQEAKTGGKPVSGSKFTFTLNGETLKVSGFRRLAYLCSTNTLRKNGTDLMADIKAQTGKEWSDPANATFTIKVPAGILVGTLVKQ